MILELASLFILLSSPDMIPLCFTLNWGPKLKSFLFEGNSVEAIVLTLGCLFLNSWVGFYWSFGLLIVCSLFAYCLHALEATSPETFAYTWRHFQDSILSLKGICFIFYLKPEDIRLSVHAHMHWLKAQHFFSTWPHRCVYVMEGMPAHRSNSGDIWYSTIGLKKRVIFGEKFKGIVNKCNCVMNMNICIALIHMLLDAKTVWRFESN